MDVRTALHRETAMKRLFKALRGPFIGAYGSRLPKERHIPPSIASNNGDPVVLVHQSLEKGSDSVQEDARPPQHAPTKISLSSSSLREAEENCNIGITPTIIAKVKGITRSIRRQERLERRRQEAAFRRINTEHKLENLLNELGEELVGPAEDTLSSESLERLEMAYKEACTKEAALSTAISAEEANIQSSRADVECALRRILQPLGVLEDDDPESEASEDSFDQTNEDADMDQPIDAPTASSEHELDVEEEQRKAATASFKEAKARLISLLLKFDNQRSFYDLDLAAYIEAVEEDRCDVSRTVFDLTHLIEGKELTQQIIEAERTYDEAACQAMTMGAIELTPSQTSCFVDQDGDGEESTTSMTETECAQAQARTNISRIERWKERLVDDGGNEPLSEEADVWDIRSIDFGEAATAIADGREKVKLDRWNRLRVEDWRIMLGRDFEKPQTEADVVFVGLYTPVKARRRSAAQSCTW